MFISTKGRYALRVLIDLAQRGDEEYVPLKDIAQRQEISQKYLEGIMSALSKAGMVDGVHGKGGGYKLKRPAEEYSLKDILAVTETSLAPVSCLDKNAQPCKRASECKTLNLWKKLDSMLDNFFGNINLAQIVDGNI
ncbi:MAG: RrF2 family transcriptional regulator [Clostridia bacterium]|nr:RrF2 family transcriptional regulator [Clostridia bacterium]MDE7336641.1 RrF2 family transcriptional regulator [Clostridia bacterium]